MWYIPAVELYSALKRNEIQKKEKEWNSYALQSRWIFKTLNRPSIKGHIVLLHVYELPIIATGDIK